MKEKSTRQLKVSENIRHILTDMFLKGQVKHIKLFDKKIFVNYVDVSIDLTSAKVYVSAFNKAESDDIVLALNESAGYIKGKLGRRMKIRSVPNLIFIKDTLIEDTEEINKRLDDLTSGF